MTLLVRNKAGEAAAGTLAFVYFIMAGRLALAVAVEPYFSNDRWPLLAAGADPRPGGFKADVAEERQAAGNHGHQRLDPPVRAEQPQQATQDGDDEALGQDLTHDSRALGA